MARPIKEGLDYFPHDTDATNDEKVEALRAMYQNDGYTFYFIILERIYRTSNAELDISQKPVRAALISKMMITSDQFDEMLQTALEINCFDKEQYEQSGILTSNGIKRRANEINGMRERWRNRKKKHNDSSVVIQGENSEETGESKVKESKVKESIYEEPDPLFKEIQNEYLSIVCKTILSSNDMVSISDMMKLTNNNGKLILSVIKEVSENAKGKIGSFNYFVPAIKEAFAAINKPDKTENTLAVYRRMNDA